MSKRFPWAKLIFATGLCLCLSLHVLLVGYPILKRELPVEPDDAYTYLLESVRLAHAEGAQNKAFKTLHSQFDEIAESDREDKPMANERRQMANEVRGRLFVVYHPLHSLTLLMLKKTTGLSWETVYGISQLVGLTLIILGIGLWLRALWGNSAAGIGLCILAVSVLPGQGYDIVVPSNIALGLALLSWAPLLQGKRYGIAALVVGCIGIPFVHPIGRIYAIVAVGLLFLLDHGSTRLQKIGATCLCLISIPISMMVFAYLSNSPDGFGLDYQGVVQQLIGIWANMRDSRLTISRTPFVSRSLFICFIIPVVAFFSALPEARRRLSVTGFFLFGLLVASWFLVLPGHSADLFTRFWVVVAVVYAGAIGQFVVATVKLAVRQLIPADPRSFLTGDYHISDTRPLLKKVAAAIGCLIVLHAASSLTIRGADSLKTASMAMMKRGDYHYDAEFCKRLLSNSNPNDVVVYGNLDLMLYCLVHGMLDRGALLNRLPLKSTAKTDKGINKDNVRFIVFHSPLSQAHNFADINGLKLGTSCSLVFSGIAAPDALVAEIYIKNVSHKKETVGFAGSSVSGGDTFSTTSVIDVPGMFEGWIKVPQLGQMSTSPLKLRLSTKSNTLRVGGLRVDAEQKSRWPWDQGVGVRLIPTAPRETAIDIRFETKTWHEGLLASARVIDDERGSVLAEIVR